MLILLLSKRKMRTEWATSCTISKEVVLELPRVPLGCAMLSILVPRVRARLGRLLGGSIPSVPVRPFLHNVISTKGSLDDSVAITSPSLSANNQATSLGQGSSSIVTHTLLLDNVLHQLQSALCEETQKQRYSRCMGWVPG